MIVLFPFPRTVSTATQVPYFGDPEVVLQDVRCSGTEFTLTECFSLGVNVDSNCNFPIYIAGVQCQRGKEVMNIVLTIMV